MAALDLAPPPDFSCPVCWEPYRSYGFLKPKLLPCLHRVCLGCLLQLEQVSDNEEHADVSDNGEHAVVVRCPLCRQTCDVPASGVHAFATDLTAVEGEIPRCRTCLDDVITAARVRKRCARRTCNISALTLLLLVAFVWPVMYFVSHV